MKKLIVISFSLCLFPLFVNAQNAKFGLHTEIGGGVALDYGNFSTLQLHVSPGFRLSPSWFVGMGVGLHYQIDSDGAVRLSPTYPGNTYYKSECTNFFSIPVYAHATYTLPTRSAWAPYVNLKLGYGIVDSSFKEDYGIDYTRFERAGGLYLSPALGVKYKLNTKHALSLSASYEMLNYKMSGYPTYRLSGTHDYMVGRRQTGSLSFRLGWEF